MDDLMIYQQLMAMAPNEVPEWFEYDGELPKPKYVPRLLDDPRLSKVERELIRVHWDDEGDEFFETPSRLCVNSEWTEITPPFLIDLRTKVLDIRGRIYDLKEQNAKLQKNSTEIIHFAWRKHFADQIIKISNLGH